MVDCFAGSNDPLHLKPNPANMVSKLEDSHSSDEEESEDEESEATKKSGVYKPPMISAAHYGTVITKWSLSAVLQCILLTPVHCVWTTDTLPRFITWWN